MCAIEWEWIAQRPHFLEMELEKYYDITVASPVHFLKRIKKQKSTTIPQTFFRFLLLPYQERIPLLSHISKKLFKKKVGDFKRFDAIWLGSPLFEKYIPDDYKDVIIYDYMDDCVSMMDSEAMKRAYSLQHNHLINRADIIFASSNYLVGLLPKEVLNKTILLRNAFRGKQRIAPEFRKPGKPVRLGYVGTISSWMDWELLKDSLEEKSDVEYHFWGPVNCNVEKDNHFIFHGIVEHNHIAEEIKDMDALIMPFVINDIVKAVDPVKLYEYISYGKIIICVGYEEIERFSDYVWLYYNEKTFIELIQKLGAGELFGKYTTESQKRFLDENTWEERAVVAHQQIEDIFKRKIDNFAENIE